MATTIPNGTMISSSSAHGPRSYVAVQRPRKLSPENGRAIEMLAHAIEYLADEFSVECMNSGVKGSSAELPEMKAIELMKELNRQIYLGCPELPPLFERLRAGFRSLLGARAS